MIKKLLTLASEESIPSLDANIHYVVTDQYSESISLKKIISLLPGNIYWKGLDGRYLGCNNYLAAMCNFTSPEEVIGKRLSDIFDPEIAEAVEKNDLAVMYSGTAQYYEEYGIDENSKHAIFLSQKLPLHNLKGEVVGLLGVSLDITERKQMEEELKLAKEKAEESNLAKSRFLAVINHELRTPLASILGLLSFIDRGNLSAKEQNEIIKNIEHCTKHLLSLVDDVLEFSRLETGNFNLRLSPVNLNALLLEIYNMLKPLAYNKGLELILEKNHLPYNLLANGRVLRQIFINLITNAIKFTEKGSVTIRFQQLAQTNQKAQLKIDIADTGLGIPKDKVDLIFEPFQQLENAYTKPSSRSGTGLGLAIVKKLAQLIEAEITVTSQLETGSIFSIIAQFDTTPILKKQEVSTQLSPHQTGKKIWENKHIYPDLLSYQPLILLIEDDPIIQYIHQKMLQDLGCEVEIASSGKEALQKLNRHHLIFVDISLPDVSGFEVIKSIRKLATIGNLPIIALTAYNGKDERLACLDAGANLFKSKPISIGVLQKILVEYLKK